MRRQRRGDVDLAASRRVRKDDAPRMQMQPFAHVAARQLRIGTAIFMVAQQRRPDRGHMDAQLVRPAGQRPQSHPGRAIGGMIDDRIE